ncbi:MAG: hypothetical protein HUJ56_03265 [Erysipelotrichaceae bacterium]|nr:hypothetical protein [Erysipelotrichaceae bacterium]
MSKLRDRVEWEAVKNCFLIAETRDARDSAGNYLIDGTTDAASSKNYG